MPPESTADIFQATLGDFDLMWPRKVDPRPGLFESVWRTPAVPPTLNAPKLPCPAEETRLQAEEAFERGYRSGHEDATRDSDMRIDQMRFESERALGEARAADLLDFVRDIGARLEQGLLRIEDQHSTSIAKMLVPFLKRAMEGALLQEALESVQQAAALRPALVVRLCGPERLVGPLGREFERRGIHYEAELCNASDLTLILDSAEIDLRLGVWLEQLDESWQ